MEKEKICNAVKRLRIELEMGQAEFGKLLPGEKSISTVQRYEKEVAPVTDLIAMVAIAERKGLAEISEILRQAVMEKIDEEYPGLEDFLSAPRRSAVKSDIARGAVNAPRETALVQRIADLLADSKNETGIALKRLLPRIVREK